MNAPTNKPSSSPDPKAPPFTMADLERMVKWHRPVSAANAAIIPQIVAMAQAGKLNSALDLDGRDVAGVACLLMASLLAKKTIPFVMLQCKRSRSHRHIELTRSAFFLGGGWAHNRFPNIKFPGSLRPRKGLVIVAIGPAADYVIKRFKKWRKLGCQVIYLVPIPYVKPPKKVHKKKDKRKDKENER